MSTKKILDKIETIQEDIHNIKMSHKLMEKDLSHLKSNHLFHIEKSTALLWKWSLFIGTLILIMFVDEARTIIFEHIIK